MNKLLKRGLLGVAALAVPMSAAAVALPMAAHASSATKISPITKITSDISGTVKGNIDIPAGYTVHAEYADVTGNATVEGTLIVAHSTFDKNVFVDGGALTVINGGINVHNSLTIVGSAGDPSNGMNGFYNDAATNHIGTFTYLNNSGQLYVGLNGGPTGTIVRNFVFANNTGGSDIGGLTVTGFTNVPVPAS